MLLFQRLDYVKFQMKLHTQILVSLFFQIKNFSIWFSRKVKIPSKDVDVDLTETQNPNPKWVTTDLQLQIHWLFKGQIIYTNYLTLIK